MSCSEPRAQRGLYIYTYIPGEDLGQNASPTSHHWDYNNKAKKETNGTWYYSIISKTIIHAASSNMKSRGGMDGGWHSVSRVFSLATLFVFIGAHGST